ncbi:hypothetical protein NUW58_g588 [Xylaria curta]|uniref:Uncharacterized protein n=1 Tax=Xylaria curta TaxID=42375 RepID=A0ACC1PNP4_9PEZI|nr:hypothetical protein NUW58_g588 [Xylaria curta]
MRALLDTLVAEGEQDLEFYPCTIAIDMAEACYKRVSCHLTDKDVHAVASKSDAFITKRTLITEKLTALKKGLTEPSIFKEQLSPFEPLGGNLKKKLTETSSRNDLTLTLSEAATSSDRAENSDELETGRLGTGIDFWESV